MLGQRPTPTVVQEQEGATDSLFPGVEDLLAEYDNEITRAIEYVAGRKDRKRYHTLIDFLFCELFFEYHSACFRFYAGKGPALHILLTPAQVDAYSRHLAIAIMIARDCLQRGRRPSGWDEYVRLVMSTVEQAAREIERQKV